MHMEKWTLGRGPGRLQSILTEGRAAAPLCGPGTAGGGVAKQGWGSRSPAGGSAASPRPGLPPTQEEGVRGPRQLVHLDSAPLGAGSPALGRALAPQGAANPSFSPTVRRGSPRGAAPGAAGLRVRRRLDRGVRDRGAGSRGQGSWGFTVRLRAPPPIRAAQAPPLLFPAAAQAAAAEKAAVRRPRPLPPVPSLGGSGGDGGRRGW